MDGLNAEEKEFTGFAVVLRRPFKHTTAKPLIYIRNGRL